MCCAVINAGVVRGIVGLFGGISIFINGVVKAPCRGGTLLYIRQRRLAIKQLGPNRGYKGVLIKWPFTAAKYPAPELITRLCCCEQPGETFL
jgi:hypothetical protein